MWAWAWWLAQLAGKDGTVYIAATGGVCAFDGEGRQEWVTESELITEGKAFVQAVLAGEDTIVLAGWTIPENAAGSGGWKTPPFGSRVRGGLWRREVAL